MRMIRVRKLLIGQLGWQKPIIHISESVIWIRKTVITLIAILLQDRMESVVRFPSLRESPLYSNRVISAMSLILHSEPLELPSAMIQDASTFTTMSEIRNCH